VPAPANALLAVFKLSPSVQEDPLYSSDSFLKVVAIPPKAKPAVCDLAAARRLLAVFKFPPLAQPLPFYSSVSFAGAGFNPPAAKAAVCVPEPQSLVLPVLKEAVADHAPSPMCDAIAKPPEL